MFYYLYGTVAELLPYMAVIDCGGVGYACKTTNNTLSVLKKGEQQKIYTYFHIGDGICELYGFATERERDSFKMLLSVSGVGSKAALSILSAETPEMLAFSIMTGDERSLMAAPGIGKKTAQRIILELKDKMIKEHSDTLDFSSATVSAPVFTDKASEAIQALMSLGYSAQEVSAALKGMDTNALPLEEIIRQSLKKMLK